MSLYLSAAIIYGYIFWQILIIVDLAGFKFSDCAITCSVH